MTRPLAAALALLAGFAACRSRAAAPAPGEDERTGGGATVVLTPRALAVTGVTTESATVASVPETFATTGEIDFDPARVVVVNAPVSGRLRRLEHDVGDHVSAGDTIAAIESPEFLSGHAPVIAPRSGVVTALGAAPEQLVTAGQEILRVAGVDRVWLRVDLRGDQTRLAHAGSAVEAAVAALPGLVLHGRIATVAPSMEGATQTATARVPLENPGGRLLPGMFADVRVATGNAVRAILVPRSAVIYDGSRRLVMIKHDSTYFPAIVRLGPVAGDRVAVLAGVRPGEQVVVSGAYELYSAGYAATRGGAEGDESQ